MWILWTTWIDECTNECPSKIDQQNSLVNSLQNHHKIFMIIILLTDDPDEDLLLLPLPGVIYQPSMTGSRMSFIIKNGSLSTNV